MRTIPPWIGGKPTTGSDERTAPVWNRQIRRSSLAACITTSTAGSITASQNGPRSRTASGSTATSRSLVATWIRQRTGSNVSSETNSVSKANRPDRRMWATRSSRACFVAMSG